MIEDDFKAALHQAGLGTKDKMVADGNIHRFRIDGDKAGSKNGWYILYGDDVPAGSFGSWKTGERHGWSAKAFTTLTRQQKQFHQRRMQEAEIKRKQEQEARYKAVSGKAHSIWSEADVCLSHPYLTNKHVKPYGLRVSRGKLLIPMRDAAGVLHSLQFIDDNGVKRFLSGGRKKGCYFAIGSARDSLLIAEGYSTAATLHESTGLPIAVAFDAGNLMPVSKALREKYPNSKITICADNDANSPVNTGVIRATEAANAIEGYLAIPPINGDFNDFYTGVTR